MCVCVCGLMFACWTQLQTVLFLLTHLPTLIVNFMRRKKQAVSGFAMKVESLDGRG